MKWFGIRDRIRDPRLITPFSFVHFLSGIWLTSLFRTIFPRMKDVFWVTLAIHTLYELKDIYVSYVIKYVSDKTDNSFYNSIGDTIAFILGYVAYKYYPTDLTTISIVFAVTACIFWIPYFIPMEKLYAFYRLS